MKIKKKKYYKLKERILSLEINNERLLDNCWEYRDIVAKQKDERNKILLNFSTRKLITGKKGSGKTTFIRKKILPYINYFLIDLNNEYNEVPKQNKIIGRDEEKIIAAINRTNRIIVLEDVGCITNSRAEWLMSVIHRKQFIIVSQSIRGFEKYIDFIDTIYDFGQMDVKAELFLQRHSDKVVSMSR